MRTWKIVVIVIILFVVSIILSRCDSFKPLPDTDIRINKGDNRKENKSIKQSGKDNTINIYINSVDTIPKDTIP